MKKIFFLLTALLSLNTYAQNASFEWSSIQSNSDLKLKPREFIGETSTHFFNLRHNMGAGDVGYASEFSMDVTNKETQRTEIVYLNIRPVGEFGSRMVHSMMTIKDELYVLRQIKNNKDKHLSLTVNAVDLNGKIGESKVLAEHNFEKILFPGKFSTALSADKSKLAILKLPNYNKKATDYKAVVYCYSTSDWSLVYQEEVNLEIPPQKSPDFQLSASNNGDILFGLVHKYEKKQRNDFYAYNATKKEFTHLDLGFGLSINSQQFSIKVLADGNFNIVGSYFDEAIGKGVAGTSESQVNGIFSAYIAEAKMVNNVTFHPWTKELLKFKLGDIKKLDETKDFAKENITGHHIMNDGSVVLEFSNARVSSQTMGSGESAYKVYWMRFRQIKMWSINPKTGQINWTLLHEIDQDTENKTRNAGPAFFGQQTFTDGINIYFVYNNQAILSGKWTESDGTAYSKKEIFGNYGGAATFLKTINQNGELQNPNLKFGTPLKDMYTGRITSPMIFDADFSAKLEDGFLIRCMNGNGANFSYGRMKVVQ